MLLSTPRSPVRKEALAAALRGYLREHGPTWKVSFAGRSMAPLVPSSSLLEVEALPARLEAGDLLVFAGMAGAICCHRVIAVSDSGAALTQGFSRERPDGWIDAALHVGVVRSYWVGGRRFDWRGGTAPVPSLYRRLRQRAQARITRAARRFALAG